ncbi:MAG: hypothetical protein LUF85_02275 [Bacteroides sp.]|nr:hypothetical protein [Bacteroides sp.]
MSYREISADEVSMTTYRKDTTACILVLCDKANIYYKFVAQDFRVVQNVEKQIKFSIPSVRAGRVIEYRYRITADFYYSLSPSGRFRTNCP